MAFGGYGPKDARCRISPRSSLVGQGDASDPRVECHQLVVRSAGQKHDNLGAARWRGRWNSHLYASATRSEDSEEQTCNAPSGKFEHMPKSNGTRVRNKPSKEGISIHEGVSDAAGDVGEVQPDFDAAEVGAFGTDGGGDAGADVAGRADVAREFGVDFAELGEFVHRGPVDFFLGVEAGAHGPFVEEMEE